MLLLTLGLFLRTACLISVVAAEAASGHCAVGLSSLQDFLAPLCDLPSCACARWAVGNTCCWCEVCFVTGVLCRVQVLGRMKQAMVEHSSSASHSFLLDDDSTLPFVANEILAQMDDKVGVQGCAGPCCRRRLRQALIGLPSTWSRTPIVTE